MRLLRLNDDGSCSLHEFPSGSNVRYAVLSHTWLPDKDDEVKFADINGQREDLERIKGYAKIRFCGAQAARDGLEYFWVDTCCIDKTNTVELQTAINSMFRWYQNATKCYVYLSDVSAPSDNTGRPAKVSLWAQQFRQSRWFTRGWTLQELLAPLVVEFFDVEGVRLGDKTSLEQLIHEITGIEPGALRNEPLEKFSIATRRSWAENRECTFPEDKAYCLLGIFSVFMPYIYGEEERAFERLLREIHNQTEAEGAQSDRLLDSLPRSETAAFNSRESELLGHSMCLQNTRIELLQDITDWATTLDDRCVYILDGIAGTGKSTIARTIARAQDDMNQLGGSFFFSKGGGDASQANVLFTTLAFQLAKKIGSTKRHICDAIKEHKDITRQSFRDQWEKLIVNPLKQSNTEARSSRPSTITLVLDALDECDHERDVAAILNVFASSKMAVDIGLRILITARPSTTTIRGGIRNIPESNRRGFKLQDVSPKVINRDLTLFFKTTLSNIGYERGFAVDWPSERSICRLVEISSGLFVWASTACRYIGRRRHFVESRMDEFIREHGTIGEPQEHLNQLYTTVLEEAAREYAAYSFKERAEVYKTLGKILGVIAVLFSPLSIDSLASLLDMRPNMITETLVDLHAILNIPGLGSQERDRPIRLHHPSFREFLLDESRCTEQAFQINEKDIHNLIADNCVRLMNERLVRDVCKLRSPGADKRNMDPARIQECLPADLQYACLHWAKHYRQGEMHLRDDDETHSFFKTHFLHWLEAMNVLGKSSKIAPIMRMYQSLLMPATNSKQVPFVKDSRKFIVNLQSKVDQSQSPLQIYASALVFVRDTNKIRDHFWTELHPFLNYVRIVKADGPEPKDDYNYVCDVAFTPDGTLLASGSLDEWVRVWDTSTGAVACKYEGQTDKISAIDISLDGQLLASGSDDFTVQIWNMDTKKTRYILKGHTRWVNTVAFSPDRRWLASGSSDETVKLWDMETGEGFRSIEPNSDSVNSISYSPNGRFLAIGTSNNLIHIWDTLDQEFIQELSGHQGAVHSVQFSPDGLQILSGSDDTTIRFWEVGSSSWDRASEIETRVFKGHTSKVWAVAYSHNAEIIASGSEDMAIKIWDPISGDVLFTLKGHTSGINSVAFSPDDQRIASGSFNDDVMLWDVQGRELIGQFADFDEEQTPAPTALRVQRSDSVLEPASSSRAHAAAVTVLTFSPGGDLIASGSDDTTIKVWGTGGVEKWRSKVHRKGIRQLLFSRSGQSLASVSLDNAVRLWDSQSGSEMGVLTGHMSTVRAIRFSSGEHLLASCSDDRTVRLWPIGDDAARIIGTVAPAVFRGHRDAITDIAFSPDDQLIASCSIDGTIRIWDTAWNTHKAAQASKPVRAHEGPINAIAFSSDGERLVSCSGDQTVKVWKIPDMSCSASTRYDVAVLSVALSDDRLRVVCSLEDGSVKFWSPESDAHEHVAKAEIPLKYVAFSSCGNFVESDRGALTTASLWPNGVSARSSRARALFVDKKWVRRNEENVLWLPDDYEATCAAAWRNKGVLGHKSGAMSFIKL